MTTATRPKNVRPSTGTSTKLYANFQAEPLPLDRLVRIWLSLPESDRLGFVLALDERIADRLMEATMPAAADRPT